MFKLLNAVSGGLTQSQLIAIGAFCLSFILLVLILKFIVNRKKKPKYFKKQSLLTATEVKYLQVLNAIIGENYLIYPQINLASVIEKKGGSGFRTELFRNADFGIFNYDFTPILLIEINDNTHFRADRAERDEKVLEICKSAKLPLVTFWVKDGIDINRMRKTLEKYLYLR